jgi:hypothetical protein
VDAKSASRAAAAFLVAFATAAAPAAGNPINTGGEAAAAIIGIAALAGGITAGVFYVLYKLRWSKQAEFTGEEVTINLEPGLARVEGVYRFHNPRDEERTLTLSYPFADGEDFGEPANVVVRDDAGADVPYRWKNGKIKFDVKLKPGGDTPIRVSFEQACCGSEFTYVLTSTRSWGRALKEARFVVEAPASLGPVASTYPLERLADDGAIVKYGFTRENFSPEEELTLSWAPAAAED